jgi:hypothetical protein
MSACDPAYLVDTVAFARRSVAACQFDTRQHYFSVRQRFIDGRDTRKSGPSVSAQYRSRGANRDISRRRKTASLPPPHF